MKLVPSCRSLLSLIVTQLLAVSNAAAFLSPVGGADAAVHPRSGTGAVAAAAPIFRPIAFCRETNQSSGRAYFAITTQLNYFRVDSQVMLDTVLLRGSKS
jgi:hypothetical protein